ncbi:hypothetical protein MLD38_019944 [Melastoma candidum]|uniref:Uncharacterized protein n=1 Tax=Melastoma candidum TaxID=119954 RepID=A0ACB9QF55_9MYRT|nr:hypothetical protein MLD38_019944 [Melastoma candidum]
MAVAPSQVYVAAVPLRATAGPAQLAMTVAYSLGIWEFQHFMVLVRPPASMTSAEDVVVFDFQPRDPEDVFVALAALSGRPVAGVVRRRNLSKPPRRRCWLVGYCEEGDALEIASSFSHGWNTDLKIGIHDCRDYTNGLVKSLTGENNILESLKRSTTGRRN